jgi:ubiquinone/menaquinone biosynthesis C-methylase UbiE
MTPQSAAPSFDPWAEQYDRYRPGYPDALWITLAERLALPATPRAVDLGAGTGRATLAMAARGWQVTAVEPGAGMLGVLAKRARDAGLKVETVEASAESTRLPAAAFDVATAAQAFHWFDKPVALSEMARLLNPEGGIALFWNTRDEDASVLLKEFTQLLQSRTTGAGWWRDRPQQMEQTRDAVAHHDAFGEPELVQLRHVEQLTPDGFVAMAFTASQVQALPAEDQRGLRNDLLRLLARHGHDQQQTIEVPYLIDLWIARRSGQ